MFLAGTWQYIWYAKCLSITYNEGDRTFYDAIKFYRPEDGFTGRCRVDKQSLHHSKFPIMKHDDLCERWKNSGQQYYIRVGWLKNVKAKQQQPEDP
jgi:hypothetical protein